MELGSVAIALVAGVLLGFALARRRTTAAPASGATPAAVAPQQKQPDSLVPVTRHLPTFVDVGGMDDIKAELRDTIGLLLTHTKEAEQYRISWNGLLLHGPPGTGKSFFARAIAGEFHLAFLSIATSDLITDHVGGGPQRVEAAFAAARDHLPCLLFFDEMDAIAESRGNDTPTTSGRDVLTQLLQSVEEHRDEPRLLVVAATNDIDALDPAVIRHGRFDRHVRLDIPDEKGRRAILAAALTDRPVERTLDLDSIAAHTKGRTPAALVHAVEVASLAAFRKACGTGRVVRITGADLDHGLNHGGGEDRPTVEDWRWDRLVLPAKTLAELKQFQTLIEDPAAADRYGVDPPTGLLLTGPPGTGKTTIAKVLAAESNCSFYPVSAADVTSRWVGESERSVARLFNRARANAPSIIFIDEIDAIAG